MSAPPWLIPDWPAPSQVRAIVTTRGGGGRFGRWNTAAHVGDDALRVAANRRELQRRLGLGQVQWLEQVHGSEVVSVRAASPEPLIADGLHTWTPGLALAIQTADCLPVLLCERGGRAVGAVHAGWRGLAGGILQAAVEAFDSPPGQLLAWLGPAIGPDHFEVGGEVRAAFLGSPPLASSREAVACFAPGPRPDTFLCDLYRLAALLLRAAGVAEVYGGGRCTVCESRRFFSFRAEGVCGRMATLVWLARGD